MRRPLAQILFGAIVLLLFSPRLSLAFAPQWGREGLSLHQIAHVLFLAAMLYFIYEMRREKLQRRRGFRFLIWGSGLLALWNLDSVVGHFSEYFLDNPVILGQGLSRHLLMEDSTSWLFYITKLDHFLLLVPAFFLFYRGLKTLTEEPRSGGR